jgi:hypothetical protein
LIFFFYTYAEKSVYFGLIIVNQNHLIEIKKKDELWEV